MFLATDTGERWAREFDADLIMPRLYLGSLCDSLSALQDNGISVPNDIYSVFMYIFMYFFFRSTLSRILTLLWIRA